MTIPTDASKANLDQGTDDPKQARGDLADLVDKFNTLLTHVNEEALNVRDKGALGDGVTNDNAAFVTWLAAIAGGLGIIPAGSYVLPTGGLSIPSGTTIYCSPGAKFLCASGGDNIIVFDALGTTGTAKNITATPALNSSSVEVASGDIGTFAAEDWVEVFSDNIFDPDRTITRIGEIKRVLSASGTTVTFHGTLETPIQYSTNPQLHVITPVEDIQWYGGTFVGRTTGTDPAQLGIKFDYAVNCHVYTLRSEKMMAAAVQIFRSVNVWIHDATVFDSRKTSSGYGVSVGLSSQNCGAVNLFAFRCRHAFTTTGNAASGFNGFPIRCGVRKGVCFASIGDDWDTHAVGMEIFFDDCRSIDSGGSGFKLSMYS